MYERKEKTKENDRQEGKLKNPFVKNVKPKNSFTADCMAALTDALGLQNVIKSLLECSMVSVDKI